MRVLLVSSGAVGCGMSLLSLKKRPTVMAELQACAALGQPRLMRLYDERLRSLSNSVLPRSCSLTSNSIAARFYQQRPAQRGASPRATRASSPSSTRTTSSPTMNSIGAKLRRQRPALRPCRHPGPCGTAHHSIQYSRARHQLRRNWPPHQVTCMASTRQDPEARRRHTKPDQLSAG